MLETLTTTLLSLTESMNYWGIAFFMTIESSFIPFPSEIIIPPAAYLAAQGKLNIILVIATGLLGSLIGATINYYLAHYLGRSIIYTLVNKKFARYLLLSEAKVKKAEKHFEKYGKISTFFGRLIPAVRQLISIPAGFTKMNFPSFAFYTGLGAGLWVTILALLGYYFGANQKQIEGYAHEISIVFVATIGIGALAIIFRNIYKKRQIQIR